MIDIQNIITDSNVKFTADPATNTSIIYAGHSERRLADFMSDFPDNCYVDKKITGCGGSTLVLRNDINYVLLVPYVNLLKSKIADNTAYDVIGLYGDVSTKEITEYLTDTAAPRKIICTYDSLPRLLNTKGFNPKAFKIMIDEAHTLVNMGIFKAATCEFVLNNYNKFASFVFLTATPTKREYFPTQLEQLHLCTIAWESVREVKFNLQQVEKSVGLNNALFGLCLDYLLNKMDGNAHIFYNSVTEICAVLKKLYNLVDTETKKPLIDPSQIRIICSKSDSNGQKIEKINSRSKNKIQIGDITDPVAKVNFYTSTAFEGADVYDEEGHTYIIINGYRDTTKVDFHVLVPQICGRIRNSKYSEQINLLVSNLPEAAKYTKEEWTNTVLTRIKESEERLAFLNQNSIPEVVREDVIKAADSDKYTFRDEAKNLYVSNVALKAELQSYEALEATYVIREIEGAEISTEGYSATFKDLLLDTTKHRPFAHKPKGITKLLNNSRQCFTDALREYCEAKDLDNQLLYTIIEEKEPEFKTIYDKLGHKRIKAMEYRRTEIDKILQVTEELDDQRMMIMRSLKLSVNDFISRTEAKDKLEAVYIQFGIDAKPKATDLSKWFTLKEAKSKGINGFKIVGFGGTD